MKHLFVSPPIIWLLRCKHPYTVHENRASYVVGHPHNRLHALETLEIFWVTEGERFVYIKVTISIKIVGFFPLTDQEHMDITKMAAMWWDYYYKIAAVLNLNQRLQSWYQKTFSLIWLISAVIKKHSVFIQYIQLRTFLKFLRIPLRIGVGQLLSLHF